MILTERQREALQHYASGLSTDEVVRAMGLSSRKTVDNTVHAAYKRLGVGTLLPAILKAASLGEVQIGEASGVSYCPVHAGVLNEDDWRCDFARNLADSGLGDESDFDEDGEPYPCDPRPLFYIPKETDR